LPTRPDTRFFESLGPVTLGAVAELTGASVAADAAGRLVEVAAVLSAAERSAVSFLADGRHAASAGVTQAGACFVRADAVESLPEGCVPLTCGLPQAAWAIAATSLHRPREFDPDAPSVHPTAMLESGVRVGQGVVIGAGAQIGANTVVSPGAVIGPGVAIGRDCVVGARAVVGFALIGDRVRIYGGAVIGEAGFGVTLGPGGLVDIPQLGRVILQDNVAIGANSCVDRGAFDDTVIGENSKIDNLVQIAHNVVIGRNCVVAGHSGLSGSARVGDGVQLGGGVGLADHVTVGDGARVGARGGVTRDIPPGQTWVGYPARPYREFFREVSWLTRAAAQRKARGEG